MSQIPFVDLLPLYNELKAETDAAIARVIEQSSFIRGSDVAEFERELAASIGVAHAAGVASATAGLWIVLKALDIGPGDEVITTVHTAVCTAEAIVLSGARVRFIDIDPATYQMDPALLEAAIDSRTKAIMPVHLYGIPCDLNAIGAIAARHNLPIIEDCAQAQGAEYRGRRVGSFGTAGVYSFFPSKNLGALGDGGAIASNREDLTRFATMFSNHGRIDKYLHEIKGTNERLDTLQAAVLRVRLKNLDAWNEQRRRIASIYFDHLRDIPEVVLPEIYPDSVPVWHLFVVRLPDRDDCAAHLKNHGIGTGLHYPTPLHVQPSMAEGYQPGDFPKAEEACREILSLPMYAHLTSENALRVCEEVKNWVRTRKPAVATG